MRIRALLLLSFLALHLPGQDAAGTAPPAPRPNVVWLVVEDMSPWLPCYGDATVPTPHLDELAAQGVRYVHAFANSPVCAAARSALITGAYATRIGTMHHRTNAPSKDAVARDPHAYDAVPAYEGVPPAWLRCFPEVLRARGYYCTNNSKQDYQFAAPVTVWDDSSGKAHWRNRPPGKPFFAVFNHGGTHESRAFPAAKPSPRVVDPTRLTLPPFYPDTPAVREAMARTYDNIAAMDAWVGDKLRELEDAGLRETTTVMFYSDHGVGLPRGKRSCYDTGLRVPLLVRFADGRGAGSTEDRVVSFVDFGPAVLSLCGVDPDRRLDGVPFLGPFARAGTGLAFGSGDRFDTVYDRQRTVTDGRWRYVRNGITEAPYLLPNVYREQLPMMQDLYAMREPGAHTTAAQWQLAAHTRPREELYDARQDPWEVRNLAADPEHRERLAALRAAVDGWVADTADLGLVLPEARLVRETLWPPDGAQPTTPAAVARCEAGDGSRRVTLACPEPGASIGWRVGDGGPWRVYTEPFDVASGVRVAVTTHRIGWKPTTITVE